MNRDAIAALLPHGGSMVLLASVECWTADAIVCRSRSHLDPANPLRRAGALASVAGIEYGMQAAALHGALLAGGRQPTGYLVSLRGIALHADRLDDPSFGALRVLAWLEHQGKDGLIYRFDIRAADGRPLVSGRGTVALMQP